jgi:hypothetical protein
VHDPLVLLLLRVLAAGRAVHADVDAVALQHGRSVFGLGSML